MHKLVSFLLAVTVAATLSAQTTVCCCGGCGSSGGGSGTVTSVAATVPSVMTVSGSPVTTSGTLGFDFASQLQNLIFASPNGSSGTPLFRSLVAADLPATITSNTTGNAATATSATTASSATTATTAATATALAANPTDCTSGQFANAIDASGNLTCGTPSGGGGAAGPVADTTSIVEGSADATKELRFEVDGFTTGTTRVATWPDANITVARTDAAQTFTGLQTFTNGATFPVGASTNQIIGSVTTPANPISLTAIGSGANCGATSGFNSETVCIGSSVTATPARRNVVIGHNAFSNTNDCTRIGWGGGCTVAGSVAIGSGATTTAANSMIFTTGGSGGGLTSNVANSVLFAGIDADITNFTVGDGFTSGSPAAMTFRTTSGTGTNIDGAAMVMSPGAGTGTGRGGPFVAQTTPSTTSGTGTGTAMDRYRAEAKAVALTDGGTTDLFDVSLPAGGFANLTFSYGMQATDGTILQSLSGIVNVTAVNAGGTIAMDIQKVKHGDDGTEVFAGAGTGGPGTFTVGWFAIAGTNKITIRVTPDSSLTAPTMSVFYQIHNNAQQTITPL